MLTLLRLLRLLRLLCCAAQVAALEPEVVYNEAARMLTLRSSTTKQQKLPGSVALICAGTADAGVVEECRLMLQASGLAGWLGGRQSEGVGRLQRGKWRPVGGCRLMLGSPTNLP